MSEINEQKETGEKIQNLKPFSYYKDETREARKDAYLVAIALNSKSHNVANVVAERQGYSTDMARQAKLMYILFRNFEHSVWGHLVPGYLPYKDDKDDEHRTSLDSQMRTFACTWGKSPAQPHREHIGTLKIKRYPDSPIMFWDFVLFDEDNQNNGEHDGIICSSSKIGTETFVDKQYLTDRFWCTPNHASIDLPARGTTIEFCDDIRVSSVTINRLSNYRGGSGLYKWTRKFIKADGQLLFTREFIPHHTHEERTKAVLRTMYSDHELGQPVSEVAYWSLYLTKEILKQARNRKNKFLHTFTTKYKVSSPMRLNSEPRLLPGTNDLMDGHKRIISFGEKNNNAMTETDILSTVQLLRADNPELYAYSTFMPTTKSLDDIYLDIYDQAPKTIDSYKVIMRMLDLNWTDIFINAYNILIAK